jgi:hypothetical protein
MKAAIITKTLTKVQSENNEYSLGFNRLTALPKRVRLNMGKAIILKYDRLPLPGEESDYLGSLTDQEFINFLKLA